MSDSFATRFGRDRLTCLKWRRLFPCHSCVCWNAGVHLVTCVRYRRNWASSTNRRMNWSHRPKRYVFQSHLSVYLSFFHGALLFVMSLSACYSTPSLICKAQTEKRARFVGTFYLVRFYGEAFGPYLNGMHICLSCDTVDSAAYTCMSVCLRLLQAVNLFMWSRSWPARPMS